jgi:hypothetical protein
MKYLKRFNEEASLEEWCRKLWITNYDIVNNVINVTKSVFLNDKKLEIIPVKFGVVYKDFYCNNNKLTSLEGCPEEVGGDLNCNNNRLTTLEGSSKKVGGMFTCTQNPVYALYKIFPNYESYLLSLNYKYLIGDKIDKRNFISACEKIGIEVPNFIPGYEYI